MPSIARAELSEFARPDTSDSTAARTTVLNFTDVTIRRGPRVLFADATFGLFRGEKIGITGANGSGKSSLLALVRGELHPDAGTFEMPGNLAVAHVSQELLTTEAPAIEFVLDGDAELRELERSMADAEARNDGLHLGELFARYQAIGGYDARSRAGRLLHGLGFTTEDESRPVRDFSGGWRVRLNVAQALMCRSDLLLLDEPTNHLDLDAVLWLEKWLREYPGTLLLIAHDREFLDRIVNRIVHIERQGIRAYRGNYSAFEEQRAAELAEQSALYSRQQREIRHMESFVERFRAKASKARQAQSRLKALERMQRIAPAHVDSPFEFSFAQPAKLPRPLLALDEQSAGYASALDKSARVILKGVSLSLNPGDRLALLGRNGAGKSTLMKLLAGELAPLGGTRTEARDLRIGYFAQHQLEQLDTGDSPLGNLRRVGGELAARSTEQELRDFLAGFGFRGDRVFEPVGPFSGGEKARLVLALVTYLRPNLLLLDEPTNHLDLEMRQALAVALQEYEGAVVLVSHDRHLLRTVADEFRIVHDGRAEPFDGDLEDYASWLDRASAQERVITPGRAAEPPAAASSERPEPTPVQPRATEPEETLTAEGRKQRKRDEAERRNRLTPLKARVAKCDAELERLATETAALQEKLNDPALYVESAKDQLRQLLEKQTQLVRATEKAEAEWMAASEALEAQAGS
ncbi:MAG TPA: ATP-binding cassette domain-containing protein [Steroidobacteraceae bacterium]|nr:ATP-binding cassette domain-containing protein [Steroidobacteraceae bacterium]